MGIDHPLLFRVSGCGLLMGVELWVFCGFGFFVGLMSFTMDNVFGFGFLWVFSMMMVVVCVQWWWV